jgi:hypothetical protein
MEFDIEHLAAAVHQSFLSEAERSLLRAAHPAERDRAWTIDPAIQHVYELLEPDMKEANRAAARRIPEHLALMDFIVLPKTEVDDSWRPILHAAIEAQLDILAQAEHLGWCTERRLSGWTYGKPRDNTRKHHPLLVSWSELEPSNQDKDRSIIRSIPSVLDSAGFKAVPGPTSDASG